MTQPNETPEFPGRFMDGKGRWLDNVFIEHLWRSVKYEEVYLNAYENPRQTQAGLDW